MWKKPRRLLNSLQQQVATNHSLGGPIPLLYHYVEVSPNKITNHDKWNTYFTNRLQDRKPRFSVTSEVSFVP